MLVLTLGGECNFLFSITSSSCHELLPGYHPILYSNTPVQLTFRNATVQEGMKENRSWWGGDVTAYPFTTSGVGGGRVLKQDSNSYEGDPG